jgi:hypothetical protein
VSKQLSRSWPFVARLNTVGMISVPYMPEGSRSNWGSDGRSPQRYSNYSNFDHRIIVPNNNNNNTVYCACLSRPRPASTALARPASCDERTLSASYSLTGRPCAMAGSIALGRNEILHGGEPVTAA